jgi:hypothetical protein
MLLNTPRARCRILGCRRQLRGMEAGMGGGIRRAPHGQELLGLGGCQADGDMQAGAVLAW